MLACLLANALVVPRHARQEMHACHFGWMTVVWMLAAGVRQPRGNTWLRLRRGAPHWSSLLPRTQCMSLSRLAAMTPRSLWQRVPWVQRALFALHPFVALLVLAPVLSRPPPWACISDDPLQVLFVVTTT
jgi:hypothetical protein